MCQYLMKNTHLGLSKLDLGSYSCFQSSESSILGCKKNPKHLNITCQGFWGQQSQKEDQSEIKIKTTERQNMLVPGYPGSEYLLNTFALMTSADTEMLLLFQ